MSSTVVLLLGVVALGGCNDRPTGPAATAQRLSAARATGLPITEGLASPEWQEIARNFVMQSTVSRNSAAATRVYAYLSMAQHGAEAIARAITDGFDQPWTGTVPVGPGLWFSSAKPPQPPVNAQLPGMRPFFLRSADQFRPAPPSAFGSPAYLAALAEVRNISDTRTAEQVNIAMFWAKGAGTSSISGFWNVMATGWIDESGLREREATHVFALLDAAMMDAAIGCFDAKVTYWFIRPPQADPAIKLIPAIGLPNHPSYPSAHSCFSGAAAEMLSEFFPAKADSLNAMVDQAGLARIYAGIHYRFDVDEGQQLGRRVARFVSEVDRSRGSAVAERRGL